MVFNTDDDWGNAKLTRHIKDLFHCKRCDVGLLLIVKK